MHRSVLAIVATVAIALVGVDQRQTSAAPAPMELPFFYDLYTFRGYDVDHTTVIATYAVPTGRLERDREDWGDVYRFDVTLVLTDTALRSVNRRDDSVFVRVPRSLGRDHLLSTHIEVPASPSRSTTQRVILTDASTPGIGQLYQSPFPIPDYSGDELMLSDVALGLPDAETGWVRGDNTLALLPTGQIPGRDFDVYYEIYNLPAGTSYLTRITIDRLDAEDDPITLQFTSDALSDENETVHELRRVATSLDEGAYELTVSVTDESNGASATRSRSLVVRDWGRGATLVRALRRNSSH